MGLSQINVGYMQRNPAIWERGSVPLSFNMCDVSYIWMRLVSVGGAGGSVYTEWNNLNFTAAMAEGRSFCTNVLKIVCEWNYCVEE